MQCWQVLTLYMNWHFNNVYELAVNITIEPM